VSEQLENLSDSYNSAKLDLQALYNYKGEEFKGNSSIPSLTTDKWRGLNEGWRKKFIKEAREAIKERAEVIFVDNSDYSLVSCIALK
jgi:hypothetical protein